MLCYSHKACCLLYYLCETDSGIHMYQFTFTLLFSDVVVVSDLNKNFHGLTDLAKKRHGSTDLHTPIHPPPYCKLVSVVTTQYFSMKEKLLCQVTFKYNQMMILIQQFLPMHFCSNSTDKNLS